MSKRQVAKWIEINIGDSTNSGSDTILRYALGGIDITHGGNVFKADGNLISIGDIEQSLGFRKTSLVIKLNSTNLTNLAHVNARKYRNKSVKVWIGMRGTDGLITSGSIKQIFGGQCDTHDVSRKTISIKAEAFWARFEQPSGTRTSSAAQSYNIKNGAYDGVATTTVDKGFDFTDIDYSNLVLGKVPARAIEHTQVIVGPRRYLGLFGPRSRTTVTTVEHIPGREGDQLSDAGGDYTRPVVFGRAHATGNLIHAFNPAQAKIDSVYPTMSNSSVIADTTEATKYVTMVFAVAEGPVNDISVMFNDLTGTATLDAFAMGDNDTGTIKNSDGEVVGVIETKLGSHTQTSFANLVTLSDEWTTDHRCLATALVMITLAASDAYGEGFPDFSFNVGGKQHPQVSLTDGVYSLGTNTYGNTATSSTVFSRPTATTAYTVTTPTTTNVVNSASPAYAILDVLLNKPYGLGNVITVADIDLKSFYDANTYERDESTPQGGNYPTVCRGVLNGAKSFKEIIDSLLAVAKANLTVVDGKITLASNRYLGTDADTRSTVKTFHEGNIINGIQDIKFAPSNRVFNEITITVPVSNSLNTEPYSLTVEDANALAEDGGQKSEKILTVPMASVQLDADGVPDNKSKEVVEEIGRFALRRSRLFGRGSFDVDYWSNTDLKPGDVINVSSKRYNRTGSDSILAKVTKILFKKNGVLSLEWSEYSNLIYDVSLSDITSVSRGSFPDTAFGTPPNFGPPTAAQGEVGPAGGATITRYGRFITESPTAPTTANGLDSDWFSTPDLISAGYTHTTEREGTVATEGVASQDTFALTGNGGGSYAAAQPEKYTITGTSLSQSASTGSGSPAKFRFSLSGDSGSNFSLGNQLHNSELSDGYTYLLLEDSTWIRTNDGLAVTEIVTALSSVHSIGYDGTNYLYVDNTGDIYSFTSFPITDSGSTKVFNGSTVLRSITYNSTLSLWCAVGDSGTILTSSDRNSWTARTSGVTFQLGDVEVINGRFYNYAFDYIRGTSSDGITWVNNSSLAGVVPSLAYDGSNYYGWSGRGKIRTSSDGITFTELTGLSGLPSTGIAADITYDTTVGRFILATVAGIYTSYDAKAWVRRQPGVSNDNFTTLIRILNTGGTNWLVRSDYPGNSSSSNGTSWVSVESSESSRVDIRVPSSSSGFSGSAFSFSGGLTTSPALNNDFVTRFNGNTTLSGTATASIDGSDVLITLNNNFATANTMSLELFDNSGSVTASSITKTNGEDANINSAVFFSEDGEQLSISVLYDSQLVGTAAMEEIKSDINAAAGFPYTATRSGLVVSLTSTSNINRPDLLLTFADGADGNLSSTLTLVKVQDGIVANTTLSSGSTASVITITKSGGERNGTETITLGAGQSISDASVRTAITTAFNTLYLRSTRTGDSYLATSVEQKVVTVTMSISDGASPVKTAAVTNTDTRTGTNPVITFTGEFWSNPTNTGIIAVQPQSPRARFRTLYYTVSQAAQPSEASGTYNFFSEAFDDLPENWSLDRSTLEIKQGNVYWISEVDVKELAFGGNQDNVFSVPQKLFTLENILSGNIAATDKITAGTAEGKRTEIDGNGETRWFDSDNNEIVSAGYGPDEVLDGNTGNSLLKVGIKSGVSSNRPRGLLVESEHAKGEGIHVSVNNTVSDSSGVGIWQNGLSGKGMYLDKTNTSNEDHVVQIENKGSGSCIFTKTTKASSFSAPNIYSESNNTNTTLNGAGIYSVKNNGGYAFYASTTGTDYGTFTGGHDGVVLGTFSGEIGDIVVDSGIAYKNGISNSITEMALSSSSKQKSAVGVLASQPVTPRVSDLGGGEIGASSSLTPQKTTELADEGKKMIIVNAVGEGQINVINQGGDIEVGDLIVTSSTAGKGMKQSDDIVRNYTVAKSRENVTWTEGETDVKMIACIYLGG